MNVDVEVCFLENNPISNEIEAQSQLKWKQKFEPCHACDVPKIKNLIGVVDFIKYSRDIPKNKNQVQNGFFLFIKIINFINIIWKFDSTAVFVTCTRNVLLNFAHDFASLILNVRKHKIFIQYKERL